MTPEEFQRAERIFQAADALPVEERLAFVEEACAGNEGLLRRVRALLQHDQAPGIAFRSGMGAIATGVGVGPADFAPVTEEMPERVASYRLIRPLGEGGFGIVYLAEQEHPRRTVAVKMLRGDLVSASARKRFEYEAQVLGRLHHPGIAQIFEAGVDGSGPYARAFFAMEYVRGRNLIDFVRDAAGEHGGPLSIQRRIELFARVCDGLHHAHLNGVIHRDLKPENILVREQIAAAEPPGSSSPPPAADLESYSPKILDFGVARIIDSSVDPLETIARTGAGRIVGTLGYMSPEQVSGNSRTIDTRSDIYSAGVVLYQLLSDRLPCDLAGLSIRDSLRVICEVEPAPLGKIDRRFRGDIETIVAKAMAKDPERRYQSAAAFALDLRKYLRHEPITARSASTIYQIQMLARRHKPAVVGIVAAVVVFFLGAAGTTWQAVRATREWHRAQVESRKSGRISEFLQTILTSADPNRSRGREVSVRELLDRSAERVLTELNDEPEIEAAVLTTIGDTYASLGAYGPAEEHLRRALAIRRRLFGETHRDVAASALALAHVLRDTERFAEAFELSRSAVSIHERLVGRENIAHVRYLMMYGDLLHAQRPDFEEAERVYLEAIDIADRLLGRRNPYTGAVLGNMGSMYVDLFRYSDAERVLEEAYETTNESYGALHGATVMNAHNYATVLQTLGKPERAEAIERVALNSAIELYGPDHPETARNMVLMAELLLARGDVEGAEPLARQALAARKAGLPENHRLVTWAQVLLADVLASRGDPVSAAQAEALAREAMQSYVDLGRATHWPFFEARSVLGASIAAQGRHDEAEPLLLESLEELERMQGPRGRAVRSALGRIIKLYERSGRGKRGDHYRNMLNAPRSP